MLWALGMASATLLGACGGGGDPAEPNFGAAPALESPMTQAAGQPFPGADPDANGQTEPATLAGPAGDPAASAQSLAPAVPAALLEPGAMKWNPGHYVVFDSEVGDHAIDTGLREIRDLPVVKGIVLRAHWSQLEAQRDVYRFWRTDRYLARAVAEDKRFFLLLSIRGFSLGVVAPEYLRSPYYGGGTYRFRTNRDTLGENLTLWNDRACNRLIRLIQALARRYNGHPNFEGLIIGETAFGPPVEPVTEEQKAGYFAALTRVDTAARRAFANTVVIQFVNYPVDRTPPIVANLLDKGIGLGSPDVFLDDPQHEEFIYPFADQARGRIPIGMQVEHHSYVSTSVHGPADFPPVRDIYVFARDRLHSNYVFWERDLFEPYRAWTKVLAMFRSPNFPSSPSGGLAAQCPSKYARCVRQAP